MCARFAAGDAYVRWLVEETDIYMVMSLNPDGHEAGTRYNSNGVDLNRNFPDQVANETAELQPETRAAVNFMRQHTFALGATLHAGALVCNYPWDGYSSGLPGRGAPSLCPDDALYGHIPARAPAAGSAIVEAQLLEVKLLRSRQTKNFCKGTKDARGAIRDTLPAAGPPLRLPPPGPRRAPQGQVFRGGITNGAEYFAMYGGFQDWSYSQLGMMHVTLELGDEKSPGPQRLGAEWAANRRALYGLIAQVHAGARGRVLCACGAGPARPATKATLTFLPGAPPRACGAGCGAAPPPLAQEIATRADPSTGHYHRVLLPGAARRGVGRARREQQRIAKLDQVLQTVPYQYENRAALRNHVVNLLQSTPTLVPAAQEFRSPGKTATLFYLGGVLPINYKGATYNIPVTIYAVVCGPPRCFVTPSGSMALKQPHPNVDAGGMITELIPAVGAVFSQNPPVYSTQPAAAPECLHGRSLLNSQMGTALMGNGLPVAAATPVPVRPTATISAAQRALYFTAPSFEPPVIQPGHSGAKERLIAEATRGLRERWTLALDPVVDDLNAQADRKAALQAAAAKVGGQMEDLRRAAADAGRDAEDLKAKEEELRKFLERQVFRLPPRHGAPGPSATGLVLWIGALRTPS
ncbi:unnamed protein product [Prorocentrum cordatum]|uniref:Peptidase M14 carboxypeptidase A domain-containing protein n=1 Tax=Prorocentrum cordatum TaxID=2364126 RepID=A0ABN9QEY8_9DINO|nr:unnamed protein product [Polarella glacialis]